MIAELCGGLQGFKCPGKSDLWNKTSLFSKDQRDTEGAQSVGDKGVPSLGAGVSLWDLSPAFSGAGRGFREILLSLRGAGLFPGSRLLMLLVLD